MHSIKQLLRPLFCDFGCFTGIPSHPPSLKARAKACLILTLFALLFLWRLGLFILSIQQKIEHASIRRGFSCVRIGCSALISVLLIYKNRQIATFRGHMLALYSDLPQLDPPSLHLQVVRVILWSTTGLVWWHVVYALFHSFLSDAQSASREKYFAEMWYGLNVSQMSPLATSLAWSVESTSYVIGADVLVYLPALFYAGSCILLKARFRDFRRLLAAQRPQWSTTSQFLQHLQGLHSILVDVVEELEDTFSQIIFLVCVACVADICSSLYNFFDDNPLYFTVGKSDMLMLRDGMEQFKFIFLLWFFLLLSTSASIVNEEPALALPLVERLVLNAESMSVASSLRASFLLSRFSRPFVRLTAGKVFVVTRGFVFNVLGAIMTYGIIALQYVHLGQSSAQKA